jgi:D-alanyl-D-alanine carboxypeptidase
MRNHNGLIGRYPGADGMKTGFICASGFNVVASAQRGNRRLITVVLGSNSANERTLIAADLFDRGFMAQATIANPTLEALQTSVLASPPNMRAVVCDRRGPMPGEDDSGGTVSASVDAGIPNLLSSNVLAYSGASAQPTRTTLGPRAPVQPVRVWIGPNPPNEADLAEQAAQEEAEEQARLAKKAKRVAKRTEPAAKSSAESTLAAPPAILDEGKGGRQSLTFKPVSGNAPDNKPKAISVKADIKPSAPAKVVPKKPDPKAEAKEKPDVKAETKAKPDAKAEAKAKPDTKADAKAKPDTKAEAKAKSDTKTN